MHVEGLTGWLSETGKNAELSCSQVVELTLPRCFAGAWSERDGNYLGNFHFSFGCKLGQRGVEVTWVISIFFWCKGYHDDVGARWADVSPLVEDAR